MITVKFKNGESRLPETVVEFQTLVKDLVRYLMEQGQDTHINTSIVAQILSNGFADEYVAACSEEILKRLKGLEK